MSKRRNFELLSIAAGALLAGSASLYAIDTAVRHGSHEGHEGMMMMHHDGDSKMAEADTNGDGAIDAAEWNAMFAKIDANNDGKLERDEMMRFHGGPPPEALAMMIAHHADANRDGKVTAAEWKAHVAEVDKNGDGALSADELQFRRRMPEGEATAPAPAELPPFVTQWDTNGDGTLEASELDALFAAADKDGDGVLTFEHREEFGGFRRR
ncbi:MAG TPA: EF-hand domain-containing protein [Thermoanaerobaculia bacterium]|jgi:Ca2+-binding EF-hand superfamily protein|nr:EF-hand domain-containing protein [Thermoanaerobaculia bacterium]